MIWEIHALDWIVWIVLSILYFLMFTVEDPVGWENAGIFVLWLMLSVVYCVFMSYYDFAVPTIIWI